MAMKYYNFDGSLKFIKSLHSSTVLVSGRDCIRPQVVSNVAVRAHNVPATMCDPWIKTLLKSTGASDAECERGAAANVSVITLA